LPEATNDLGVTLLLCDSAQALAGKLYILGAGWRQVQPMPSGTPIQMALGILVEIPQHLANREFSLVTRLESAAGALVEFGQGPVTVATKLEVRLPPGTPPDAPLAANLAVNMGLLPLGAGHYAWVVAMDDEVMARAPFEVLA
jgi:hypothetical protein